MKSTGMAVLKHFGGRGVFDWRKGVQRNVRPTLNHIMQVADLQLVLGSADIQWLQSVPSVTEGYTVLSPIPIALQNPPKPRKDSSLDSSDRSQTA